MDPWEMFSEMCRRVVTEQNVYLDVLVTPTAIEMKWSYYLMIRRTGRMRRPTRFYSSKQEKQVAKKLGGKQVANSGTR